MGFLLTEHRNGGMISDRNKRRFDCPCCGKARPKSWWVALTSVHKETHETKRFAVCKKCWQNVGLVYQALGTGRYYVVPEER